MNAEKSFDAATGSVLVTLPTGLVTVMSDIVAVLVKGCEFGVVFRDGGAQYLSQDDRAVALRWRDALIDAITACLPDTYARTPAGDLYDPRAVTRFQYRDPGIYIQFRGVPREVVFDVASEDEGRSFVATRVLADVSTAQQLTILPQIAWT